jgi:hypothetical protein
MGLDAVVFKNLDRMRRETGRDAFKADPVSGESLTTGGKEVPLKETVLLAKRLGNIDEVSFLWTAAAALLPPADSIVLGIVLRTGSHSGDAVPAAAFPKLKVELEVLASRGGADLTRFVADMRELLAAAESEGNPIAFV